MKSTILAFCLLALSLTSPGAGLQGPQAAPQATAEARTALLVHAFKLIGDGQIKQAKAEIERATAMMEGPCGECLLGLSHIYASEKKWEQAVEASRQSIPLLKSPGLQARAYNQLGVANVTLNTPESLTQAEEAFRHAKEAGGAWGTVAGYNLAEVLFRRQKWDEAAKTACDYLDTAGPSGTFLKEARVLLCHARAHLPDDEPSPKSGERQEPKRVEGDVQRPEILFQTPPQYTPEARKAVTQGTVILESIIDEDGCVRKMNVLQGLANGLTDAATRAVREWVFKPATLEGRPVKVYYVLTINFKVQDKLSPPF